MITEQYYTANKTITISYKRQKKDDYILHYPANPSHPLDKLQARGIKCLSQNEYPNLFHKRKNRLVFYEKIQGQTYFFKLFPNRLKSFEIRDIFNPLSLMVPSKAVKLLKFSLIMKNLNLPTCETILAIDSKQDFIKRKSILITPQMEGGNTENIIFSANHDLEYKLKIIEKIYQLAYEMYKLKIFHGDYYPRNLFYDPEKEKLTIFDLDRAVINCSIQRIMLRDFTKLTRSLLLKLIEPGQDLNKKRYILNEFTNFLTNFFEKKKFTKKELNFIFQKFTIKKIKNNERKHLLSLYKNYLNKTKLNI